MAALTLHFVLCMLLWIVKAESFRTRHGSSNKLLPYDEFLRIKKDEASCPCSDSSLCDNVKVVHAKELFGFAGNDASNISIYNWTYLTTIAWAPTSPSSSELMCYAHSKSVRLIAATNNIPFTNNETEQAIWIQQTFEQVAYYHFDGVTFDYESPFLWNSVQSQQYTALINETTQYFHRNMPGSQISVCVAWQSYLVDGRQYDYYHLAESSDLLYIMDYDTNSQNYQHQCLASANAPYQGTERGITSYLNLGIAASKLILGVPWYGYNYSCDMTQMESITSKYCPIPLDTFRGVNCSDAAGNERVFGIIYNVIDEQMNVTEIRWDTSMRAPYFNYMDKSVNADQVYQVWFDDENSLRLKYEYAQSMGIRGVGPYTFSYLTYTGSEYEMNRAQQIWSAFDAFFA